MKRVALAVLLLSACRPHAPSSPPELRSEPRKLAPASWVLKGRTRAALIRPEAGPLSGSVHAPDGDASPRHPWATVSFMEPGEEGSLRALLGASRDFEDFRRRLEAAGYSVEPLK